MQSQKRCEDVAVAIDGRHKSPHWEHQRDGTRTPPSKQTSHWHAPSTSRYTHLGKRLAWPPVGKSNCGDLWKLLPLVRFHGKVGHPQFIAIQSENRVVLPILELELLELELVAGFIFSAQLTSNEVVSPFPPCLQVDANLMPNQAFCNQERFLFSLYCF